MTVLKKKPPKCSYPDCFNCPYADCRYDRLESEDFEPDQMEDVPESVLKARTRARKRTGSVPENGMQKIKSAIRNVQRSGIMRIKPE